MSKVIIVTHGSLADGLLSAAELIVGKQEDVKTFGVELGCNLEKLKQSIIDVLEHWNKTKELVIVLTDIFFGTPFNIVMSLVETYDFVHITGVNLGMVLEILMKREELTIEDFNHIIEQGKTGIVNCSDIVSKA